MECHRCPHSRDVAGGKFAGAAFSETPCAACLDEAAAADAYHVPYDDGKGVGSVDGVVPPADLLVPLSVLGDALKLFLGLSRETLDVIRLRFAGMTYREIARELGLGRSHCSMLVVRAFDKNPVLLELLPKTKGRRERRLWRKRKRKVSGCVVGGGKQT